MNIININAKNQAQADKAIDLLAEAFGYIATIQTEKGMTTKRVDGHQSQTPTTMNRS